MGIIGILKKVDTSTNEAASSASLSITLFLGVVVLFLVFGVIFGDISVNEIVIMLQEIK